jgi:RNA-splicing ligase RtcB
MIELKGKYSKNCKIFTDDVEDSAITQIYDVLNTSCMDEDTKVRIMPDVHAGTGCTVGFTMPVLKSCINPSFIGVDISCMIDLYITDSPVNPDDFKLIEHRIKKDIPLGMEINDERVFDMKDFIKYMNDFYQKVYSQNPEIIERREITDDFLSKMCNRIGLDYGKFLKAICSLGGGNHFISLNDVDGKLAFMIHCGSRNFGNKIAKYWMSVASGRKIDKETMRTETERLKSMYKKTELREKIENLKNIVLKWKCPNGYIEGNNMRSYLSDVVVASAYAHYNHLMISRKISGILKKINGASVVDTIVSVHNYIDFEDGIIRKGSIRAHEGERCLIPLNMRDGVIIGTGKGNEDWNFSAPHGAGRRLSRSKAKETLGMDQFREEMKDVYSTSVCESTLDESPMAYKDSKEIISLIEPTVEINMIAKELINIKASTQEVPSWKEKNKHKK